MKTPTTLRPSALTTATALLALSSAAHAQILFQDTFDATTPAWTVNAGPGVNVGNAHFDYSTVGVPQAPRSVGTDRFGAFLQANNPPGVGGSLPTGVSISPNGQSFTGDYEIRFDLWQNYNGPLGPSPVGGTGSTQLTGAGLLSAGTVATYAGAGDGIWFGGTGDGGTTADYRAYIRTTHQTATSIYAAGSQSAGNAYYAGFGGDAAPAEQIALQSNQTGTTPAGALAFEWHDVKITKIGNTVTWNVDGTLLATLDISGAGEFTGNNIVFLQSDINVGPTTELNPPMLFGLIDNVTVTAVPEPSTYALLGAGGLFLATMRRRKSKK